MVKRNYKKEFVELLQMFGVTLIFTWGLMLLFVIF